MAAGEKGTIVHARRKTIHETTGVKNDPGKAVRGRTASNNQLKIIIFSFPTSDTFSTLHTLTYGGSSAVSLLDLRLLVVSAEERAGGEGEGCYPPTLSLIHCCRLTEENSSCQEALSPSNTIYLLETIPSLIPSEMATHL